ncbi:hypothetical protein [Klebsiella aerogenes]|uniref:hypothetical protein n=1 Tax=Klebsiella aerogenes TaxID=548 RepID=UPI0007B39E5C|nr:hypothetical protein [Klebsiella aerogenes]KZQ55008.1 hypothetical protein A3N61_10990 [Klebsiella aerogenes]
MTDITELAQREKFEAWAEEVGALPWGILKKHRNQDGSYPGPHYTYMWKAWQAASAELVEALEKAQQERENWRTSFDNERFRADKLKAHIDEMTEEQTASINELSRIIQKEVKAKREAEKRIAELEFRTVTVKPMRPGHITVGGEKIGIYMRDEVDEFMSALAAAGIKWEAE